jgi:SecD/SecF fusion protein
VPDRDDPLELLRELRDVGVTPPRDEALQARVSSAIAEEIEREQHPRPGGLNGRPSGWPAGERMGGARRRLGFPRLAGRLAPVVGVLVVAVVVAVFLGLRGSGPSRPAPSHGSVAPSHGSVGFVYLAEPSARAPVVTRGALERTVQVVRERLRAFGIGGARVAVSGANEITVSVPSVRNIARAVWEVGRTAQLSFYDWEANALTPNGKTVASQLRAQDPTAMTISQGTPSQPSGGPGAGSMSLYDAVKLASQQPESSSPTNSRITPEYYMFGAPGSAACEAAARANGTVLAAGQHCLLSGPDNARSDLVAGLPPGVLAFEGEILTVPRGTVVLQAIPASFANPTPIGDPSAQFFVLKDHVALGSSDITNPQQPTDRGTGTPDITFGFIAKGKSEFQAVTANIAHRGDLVSGLGQTRNQHFAVALDDQLITVPYIDFKQYPNGINGDFGAGISGSFTSTSARDLANELRLGPLPLNLNMLSPAPIPKSAPTNAGQS